MDTKEKLVANETEAIVVKPESEVRKTETSGVMQDVEARAHVPEHVKTWLEKIEVDPTQTVQDDTGQTVMQPTAPQDPKVTLPVNRTAFVAGFKKTIDDAGRWLSAFILRMIKIKGAKVKFKEE